MAKGEASFSNLLYIGKHKVYMQIRIFTLAFDEKTESFDDELIREFCQNKKVHRIETHFFRQEGQAYWSVAVHYDVVELKKADKVRELDEAGQLLYQRLREWRRETGAKEGFPVYLIATNAQLVSMIKTPCTTLESFKLVKGFGKKRIGKYGRLIVEIIKGFQEEQEKGGVAIADSSTSPPPFAE